MKTEVIRINPLTKEELEKPYLSVKLEGGETEVDALIVRAFLDAIDRERTTTDE